MFTQGWLLLAWFLIAVGIASHHAFAFLLGLIVLGSAAASYLWDRYCLARVEYHRAFTPRRAFYGETVTFTMEVVNRKPLPLAWLEVIDELPQELVVLRGRVTPSLRQRRQHLVNLFSLRWYERIRRQTTLRCDARGYFPLGPARLRSGDIFGFTVRGADVPTVDHLLVYPRVVPLAALGLPALHPIGEVRRRHPLADPTQVAGVREYTPGDPLRAIHWKATARAQRLRSKQYEASTSHRLAIFLNLDTLGRYAEYRGFVRPLLELNIMTAASVASWAVGCGYHVGLFANGYLPQGLRWVRILPAARPGQLTAVLEALATVFPTPVMPVGDLMQLEARELPWGTTAVVVSAVVDEPLRQGLIRVHEAGHDALLILIGDDADVPEVSVPTYRVAEARAWQALDDIIPHAVRAPHAKA